MRRFEQPGPTGTRFWEVEVVGTELTLRSGKVGSRDFPDEREESYRNATEAKREAERLIKSRLAAGWVERIQKAAAEDLEAALAQGDEAQWLVFADQLVARGDVRGELITLQQSLGRKRSAKAKVDAFVEEHEGALLGSLSERLMLILLILAATSDFHLERVVDGVVVAAWSSRRGRSRARATPSCSFSSTSRARGRRRSGCSSARTSRRLSRASTSPRGAAR